MQALQNLKNFRIAPTPSGYLHLGNVFNFIQNWLWCRKEGGRLLLRIDDLDGDRFRLEYLEDIFNILELLGIVPDNGPSGVYDFFKNWSQKYRLEMYTDLIDKIIASGFSFECHCSRKEIHEKNKDGVCRTHCSDVVKHRESRSQIRLNILNFKNPLIHDIQGIKHCKTIEKMGCFVIQKADGYPSYQVASVADDLHFGITHVARGVDLLESTGAQLMISQVADLQDFEKIQWFHHELLSDSRGNKLSKSAGYQSETLLASGMDNKDIVRAFCRFAGIREVNNLQDIDGLF